MAEKGVDKVLVFYCDDSDGKKSKRSACFGLWYELAEAKSSFEKYDEEIIVPDDEGNKVDTVYMSLIVERNNPNLKLLLEEFQLLKELLIADKLQ